MESSKLSRSTRRQFTLVEVIMVMVISAVIMLIALPAFEKMLKGSGTDLATRNLASMMKLARSYAVSNRKSVAVLLPDGNIDEEYCYSAYRACVVDSNNKFVHWIQGEDWKSLPAGTAVLQIDTLPGTIISADNQPEASDSALVSDVPDSSGDIRAIVFRKTGRSHDPSQTYYITVGEGKYSAGGFFVTNIENQIDISLSGYTGRVSYEN